MIYNEKYLSHSIMSNGFNDTDWAAKLLVVLSFVYWSNCLVQLQEDIAAALILMNNVEKNRCIFLCADWMLKTILNFKSGVPTTTEINWFENKVQSIQNEFELLINWLRSPQSLCSVELCYSRSDDWIKSQFLQKRILVQFHRRAWVPLSLFHAPPLWQRRRWIGSKWHVWHQVLWSFDNTSKESTHNFWKLHEKLTFCLYNHRFCNSKLLPCISWN